MPNAPMPSTLRISNSPSRVPGASASCSETFRDPDGWRESGTVVVQELSDMASPPASIAAADSRQSASPKAPRTDERRGRSGYDERAKRDESQAERREGVA